MTFGEKLQELRKGRGLSQEELAQRLGVSRQSVSKWEQDQTYPETDKLIEISRIFSLSVDSLLKYGQAAEQVPEKAEDGGDAAPDAGKGPGRGATAALCAALIVCAACAIFFFVRWRGELARQASAPDAEASAPAAEQPLDMTALRAYYFDFARTYRLDYVPFFSAGSAPAESPDYLFFAYAVNEDNWGEEKGVMSRDYVEDTVLRYFGVAGLSHMPLRKAWDYDGVVYTAYPDGLRPRPLYLLSGYTTYEENGIQYHVVTLDFCMPDSGAIPEEGEIEQLRARLVQGDMTGLTVVQREQVTYCASGANFGGPLFAEHLLLDSPG